MHRLAPGCQSNDNARLNERLVQLTAVYEERNILAIEKIYSDDAIIIVGKKVTKYTKNQNIIKAKKCWKLISSTIQRKYELSS